MTTVVKIGSSSLTRADGYLDLNRIDWVSRVQPGFCWATRPPGEPRSPWYWCLPGRFPPVPCRWGA